MGTPLAFIKATGSGNDFIIVDNRAGRVTAPPETARDLCRRGLSVGADGLLLLENSTVADFRMRIVNPDGSEAEMCANGLRCFIRYLVEMKLLGPGVEARVETGAGLRSGQADGDEVRVCLGAARDVRPHLEIDLDGRPVDAGFADTGVPHAVVEVADLEACPVYELGKKIRRHPRFAPTGTNADFVTVEDGRIRIRTYERGVEDETLSCGTGTVASALIMKLRGKVDFPVEVTARSGEILRVAGEPGRLLLSGRVRLVYEGKILP